MNVKEKISELKIVPVATIENVDHALPLAKALLDAGLPIVEVTFRTIAANESIKRIVRDYPEILIGAGTVLTIDQVKNAQEAGSKFIVTPGFNPTVVDYCVKNDIFIIPGLNAPTFVEWALERDITLVKFYPADISGGPKMLNILSGPYPKMKFMPTGGVNNETMLEYLRLKNVSAIGGSWIVPKDLIAESKFKEIIEKTKKALEILKTLETL
ncbi:MAG: bifunctional 4-hydroxy-2-oxoglutarate aldolase/2-dehydro-3-deoxy-phosphogluconate aldolase [Candidatus Lokiarchaeota archaeon]|nr:bifunctional 4-hydroxy-2-oxoglutarate aldolase/2-dehydro-3-deoxy-phosphogluconate aldolase [Candidatus Lokiarchaeota archaeon]